VEKALVPPEVARAEGSTGSGGLVVILVDGKDLADVASADYDLAPKRYISYRGMDVAYEVAEGLVEALEQASTYGAWRHHR
jgi:hypothetical protein